MTPSSRRLTFEETKQLEHSQGRICRGCRTIYAPADVPSSFGADARTKDGLTKLCISCLALRDNASTTRSRSTQADLQAEYRALRRKMLIAASQAHLDAALAQDPPRHAIPLRAMPGYPNPSSPPRTKQEDAALSLLYSKLRDAPIATWEEIAGASRHKVPDYFKLGLRSFDLIDEHLRALGLPLLTP